MSESRHTHKWIMSYIWMRYVTHMNKSYVTHIRLVLYSVIYEFYIVLFNLLYESYIVLFSLLYESYIVLFGLLYESYIPYINSSYIVLYMSRICSLQSCMWVLYVLYSLIYESDTSYISLVLHTNFYVRHSMWDTLCETLSVRHSLWDTLCETLYVRHSMWDTLCWTLYMGLVDVPSHIRLIGLWFLYMSARHKSCCTYQPVTSLTYQPVTSLRSVTNSHKHPAGPVQDVLTVGPYEWREYNYNLFEYSSPDLNSFLAQLKYKSLWDWSTQNMPTCVLSALSTGMGSNYESLL